MLEFERSFVKFVILNRIQIIKGRVSRDHIHLYISYPPKLSVSEMVRIMKGRSSRRIQEAFPQL